MSFDDAVDRGLGLIVMAICAAVALVILGSFASSVGSLMAAGLPWLALLGIGSGAVVTIFFAVVVVQGRDA